MACAQACWGLAILAPRYPRRRASQRRLEVPDVIEHIRHTRETLGYGAARTRLWLIPVHRVRLAIGTIQCVFRDLGLPYLRRTRKRAPRQLKLFEKAEPGDSVHVDVKFVRIAGRWAFQYTALDDCTQFRVLRLYGHLHHKASLAFLGELRRAFPLPIRRLQCNNGRELPLEFVLAVKATGIRHHCIRPRRPKQNCKVQRSHRIDHDELWNRQTFRDFAQTPQHVAHPDAVHEYHCRRR
jgi:hypothetical protein